MAKNIGILIDPETGDLQIDPRRNDQNVYVQGLQVGEVTIQNQAAILQAMKGELKEYPTLGVGITNIANDHETTGWAREITAQLKADGMRVNDVEVDITNNKLTVDAEITRLCWISQFRNAGLSRPRSKLPNVTVLR